MACTELVIAGVFCTAERDATQTLTSEGESSVEEMDVPTSTEYVTGEWLASMLATDERFHHVDWANCTQRRIGEGYGLDGTLLRVTAPGATLPTVVVKLGEWPAPSEPDFYASVAPEMPIRLPQCYAAAQGETSFALIMEDLHDAEQGDCLVGPTERQSDELFAATARFHARFWGGGDRRIAGRKKMTFDLKHSPEDFDARCERLFERFGIEAGPSAEASLSGLPERAAQAVAVLSDAPLTLVHTDLHLDNVMFLGDVPVILDWPGAKRGVAALDLARLLIEGLTLDQRRARQPRLVAIYRAVLAEGDIQISPDVLDDQLAAVCAITCWTTLSWAGGAEPGFDRPRVKELVRNLVINSFGAAHDNWLRT